KSANFLLALLHHISAVVRSLGHPRRACHVGSKQPFVHLLLVEAGQAGAGGHVLDGAVAVTDRKPSAAELDHLCHVPVLGGGLCQLADSSWKVSGRQARRIVRLAARGAHLAETPPVRGGTGRGV